MSFSSQHHSFDILFASKYGIDEAILIHHFQHWIRINCFQKRNQFDGKTWTYQSIKEIQAHFPYWNFDHVKYICEKLVNAGVLITCKHNKNKRDRTLWYAFVNENEFSVNQEAVLTFYQNTYKMPSEHSLSEKEKVPNAKGKSAQCIDKDTILTDTINLDKEKYKESDPSSKEPSADASSLSDFFWKKLKERNPDNKEPNKEKWARDMDCLIRIDGRLPEKIKEVICWASTHKWWSVACLSPKKLRDKFDEMVMQMKGDDFKKVIQENRDYAINLKKKYPKEMKELTFDDKFAINREYSKEVPFNLPPDSFKKALISMFGGS